MIYIIMIIPIVGISSFLLGNAYARWHTQVIMDDIMDDTAKILQLLKNTLKEDIERSKKKKKNKNQ